MAAKCGASSVYISDGDAHERSRENCTRCCQLNGVPDIPVIPITWGCFDPPLMELSPIDIILASDCFYDSKGVYIFIQKLVFLPTLY